MKINLIVFGIGEDGDVEVQPMNKISSAEGATGLVQNSLRQNNSFNGGQVDAASIEKNRLLGRVLKGGSPQQKSNAPQQEENPYYKQALRYAEGDYDQEDFTPGYHDSIHVGDAEGKTTGKYPIFASAVVAPSTIWAKKKKAVADYMLKLEDAKNNKPDNFSPDFYKSDSSIQSAISGVQLQGHQNIADIAGKTGQRLATIENPNHPLNKKYVQTQETAREQSALTNDARTQIKTLEKNPAVGVLGKEANQSIANYRAFQKLPREKQMELLTPDENGNYPAREMLQNTVSSVKNYAQLSPMVTKGIKNVKDKAESYITNNPGASYDEFLINTISSQYPPEALDRDKDGNVVLSEANKDKYLTDLATSIAQDSPSSFKDAQFGESKAKQSIYGTKTNVDETGYDADAPFTLEQLKKQLELDLGFKALKSVHTQMIPKDFGAAQSARDVTAATNWIKDRIVKDISKGGESYDNDKKNGIISGTNGATIVENGVATGVVSFSNIPAVVDAVSEHGANNKKNDYGNIASSEVNVNLRQTDKPAFKGVWDEAKKIKTTPPVVFTDGNFQENFNNTLYQISGKNKFPIANGIEVKNINSIAKDKSDKEFLIVGNAKGSVTTNGIIIPGSVMNGYQTQEGKGLFDWIRTGGNLFDKTSKVQVPIDGDYAFLGDTYYKKSDDGSYYTIMKKNKDGTSSEFHFQDDKGKEIPKEVTVPVFMIDNILNRPAELISKADTTDRELPDERVVESKNVAGKTASKESATTIKNNEAISDSANLVINHIMKNMNPVIQGKAATRQQVQEKVYKYLDTKGKDAVQIAKDKNTFNNLYNEGVKKGVTK